MASSFDAKADFFEIPFMSIPESLDGSRGTLKRKRVGDDLGPPTTFDSTTKKLKRSRSSEVPNLSGQLIEVRGPDAPLWSADTVVYVPDHERRALIDSGNCDVFPSDREPNGYYKKSQLDLQHMWHEPPTHFTSDEGSDSATRKNIRKCKTDSMTIVERKHFFIYTPTEGIKAAAKKYFSDIYQLLDMPGSNDDCRLHPKPPQSNGKPTGTISFSLKWKNEYGSHRLTVNWEIIALVVRQQLTDAQMDGFINQSWQLSHLCGNWTCCNWRHFTVESGPINCSRNGCFNCPAKCTHNPPCMKEKKRQLLVTNHIRSEISKAITSLGGILSYEAFHSLADEEIRLVEGFWENSKRGFCAFCGRSDDKAHICSCLSSLEDCKIMLRALKQCVKPTLEVGEAIGYLVKIKEDLERGSAVKDKTLTEWLVRPGRPDISIGVQPIANDKSQQVQSCTQLKLTYLQLNKTVGELKKHCIELRSKCGQPESTAEDVDLLAKLEISLRDATLAKRIATRDWRTSRRVQGRT